MRTQSNLFLLVQNMINEGIKSVAIIQSPDYCGGHNQELQLSPNKDEDWYNDLPDFTYVEWEGSPIDLLIDDPWLNKHKEPLHEEPYDSEWPWWWEVPQWWDLN